MPRLAFINKLDRAGADPWKVRTSAHIISPPTVWMQGFLLLNQCINYSETPCEFDKWYRYVWYVVWGQTLSLCRS